MIRALITLTLAVALLAAPGCVSNPADRVLAETDKRIFDNHIRPHNLAALEYRAGNPAPIDALPPITVEEMHHLRSEYLDNLGRNIDLRRGVKP